MGEALVCFSPALDEVYNYEYRARQLSLFKEYMNIFGQYDQSPSIKLEGQTIPRTKPEGVYASSAWEAQALTAMAPGMSG